MMCLKLLILLSIFVIVINGAVVVPPIYVTVKPFPPGKPGMCPTPTGIGICAFMCNGDADCGGNLKCCRTGCSGTTCQKPVQIEYLR